MHLDVTLENDAMVADIKRAIKLIRGIASVRQVRSQSTKKSGIERALDDVEAGRVYHADNVDEMFKDILG